MKQFKKNLIIICISSTAIFQNACAMGAKRPTPKPTVIPTVTPTPTPTSTVKAPYVEQITDIVSGSECANYAWKNRGRAPAGYIKGVALSFARSFCRLRKVETTPSGLATIMSSANSHNPATDALAHYQTNFSNLAISLDQAGLEPLRALYTLGIGLGMRESSGGYCEGWDKGAGANRPSSAGEAGLYQTSLDSISASVELSKLYTEYQSGNRSRCFLDIFKEGVKCSNSATLGTGAGADFQNFTKSCPAFAAEYAMTMLRIRRNHYGPINRKEAEVVASCNQMLKSVQDLINRDTQSACQDIY